VTSPAISQAKADAREPQYSSTVFSGRYAEIKLIAALGLREIEYAPIDMPVRELLPHAWSVCDHIFRSNNAVKPDDTIDVDRKNVFKVEAIERGFFGVGPALPPSWLADSKSFNPNLAAQ